MTRDILIVAVGALLGSLLRFRFVNHFKPLVVTSYTATLLVNVLACFLLGLITPMLQSNSLGSRSLSLLLCTGFLGSLSTFSTFVVDALQAWLNHQYRDLFRCLLLSLSLGTAALLIGQRLGA
ncbi:MAG: CrcB family protein [Cyanobacteria bacterium K_DeepCast_0m_m1_088]|nr:CrcB family protein [Cyanobacteria bacterium K_DeepCast_0m_m1_088]